MKTRSAKRKELESTTTPAPVPIPLTRQVSRRRIVPSSLSSPLLSQEEEELTAALRLVGGNTTREDEAEESHEDYERRQRKQKQELEFGACPRSWILDAKSGTCLYPPTGATVPVCSDKPDTVPVPVYAGDFIQCVKPHSLSIAPKVWWWKQYEARAVEEGKREEEEEEEKEGESKAEVGVGKRKKKKKPMLFVLRRQWMSVFAEPQRKILSDLVDVLKKDVTGDGVDEVNLRWIFNWVGVECLDRKLFTTSRGLAHSSQTPETAETKEAKEEKARDRRVFDKCLKRVEFLQNWFGSRSTDPLFEPFFQQRGGTRSMAEIMEWAQEQYSNLETNPFVRRVSPVGRVMSLSDSYPGRVITYVFRSLPTTEKPDNMVVELESTDI